MGEQSALNHLYTSVNKDTHVTNSWHEEAGSFEWFIFVGECQQAEHFNF